MVLEQGLAVLEVGRAAADVGGDRGQLGVELGDLGAKLGDPRLDLIDLAADLRQQALDPLVLGGDRLELGAREVQLDIQVGGTALELRELGALAVEGGLQRLLGGARIGQLGSRSSQFGFGISGKGRAAGLSCEDGPAHRQQGDERDGESGSPPHRAVIRTVQLPLCPVAREFGAMVPDAWRHRNVPECTTPGLPRCPFGPVPPGYSSSSSALARANSAPSRITTLAKYRKTRSEIPVESGPKADS